MMPAQPIGTPLESNTPSSETQTDAPPVGYISLAQLEEVLAERDRKHAEQMESVRAQIPVAQVPANSGGPGNDHHQKSWSLAEQEAAQRGETLDHWE